VPSESTDVETVQILDQLATRWNVSKSEALRRAIRAAAQQAPPRADAAFSARRSRAPAR
jgi:hypothetical protein